MRDEPGDYQVMSKWLSDPRVLEFHEGRDHPLALEQIESEYAPRIHDEEDVTPCRIILQSAPIGYMQFYLVGEESRNSYGLPADECLEAVYGIDQFIGEISCWNRGLGTCCCCGICFRPRARAMLFLIFTSRICARFGAMRNADSGE